MQRLILLQVHLVLIATCMLFKPRTLVLLMPSLPALRIAPALNVLTCITPPVNQCATGELHKTVSFVYKYSTCAQEDNEQGDASSCEDAETCAITPESTVDINCGNLFSRTVMEGNEVTISAPDGAILPKDNTCMIGASGVDVCQTVTINTSGNVDLQLKDRFGSLELVSCDDNDCFTDVTYTCTIFITLDKPT